MSSGLRMMRISMIPSRGVPSRKWSICGFAVVARMSPMIPVIISIWTGSPRRPITPVPVAGGRGAQVPAHDSVS